jgi:hypothetical protein
MANTDLEEIGIQCCFCGKSVDSSLPNPCSFTVTINFDKPQSKDHSQFFFCHLKCFQKTMHDQGSFLHRIIQMSKNLWKKLQALLS